MSRRDNLWLERRLHHSHFARMIYVARVKKNLRQKDVTELTGISQSKLSLYENDVQLPCRRNLEKLISCYGIANKDDVIEEWINEKERLLHFTAK